MQFYFIAEVYFMEIKKGAWLKMLKKKDDNKTYLITKCYSNVSEMSFPDLYA